MSEAYEEIEFYIVADSAEDAQGAWLWETLEQAEEYKQDMAYENIYSIVVRVDFSTLSKVES